MLQTYVVADETLDSLDLKVLLLGKGIRVHEEVYKTFGPTRRISLSPRACNTMFLPDSTVVHIADVGSAAPFHLELGAGGSPRLTCGGAFVTEVSFPPSVDFYRQRTSRGVLFGDLAVLQGRDSLAFPYLWPCEFAKARQACKFCHCGNYTQQQCDEGTWQDFEFTPQDVAEVVQYAVNVEKCASLVQLTAGSTFHADREIDRYVEILRAIDDAAGLDNVPGEVIVYTTPPSNPADTDRLFAAGVDRVACDMDLWDERLSRQMCPGKSKWTGRDRHLEALLHIAETQGPNKACSVFVVGMEPVETFLSGAEYLASHGIVPLPSPWMPHGVAAPNKPATPDLDYYRRLRRGVATIYENYGCEPPGDTGFNVCLGRDTWNHRAELLRVPETPCPAMP